MNPLMSIRLVGSALLCLGAIGVGSAINLPAVAATGYEQFVAPIVSATCASSTPCLTEANSKSGAGVKAASTKGDGAVGQTSFKSTSQSNGTAGVLGQDLSTSGGFDSGVLGTSANGFGVQGRSGNGNGVLALSSGQSALFAENSNFGDGVQSVALNNDGTNSSTQNPSKSLGVGRSGVWGHDDSTDGGRLNVGIAGSSTNGIGISASSSNFVGANVVGGGTVGLDFPALSVIGNSGGHALITACDASTVNPCDSFHASFVIDGIGDVITSQSIDAGGNVDIGGQYQVEGVCVAGCSRTRNGGGKAVTRYVPTASVPSVEDFGEAQLVDGQAHVQLSADFANVIDSSANYLVFITPEGDTNGVFVTQKASSGFVVRENHGGRASVAFQYRIVARPFGDHGSRLPSVELRSHLSQRTHRV